jgi:hypothetical protein
MPYVYPIGAARTATFETIAVVRHAAMSAVRIATAGTFGLQSKVCFVVVYDVFHGSLLVKISYQVSSLISTPSANTPIS